MHQFEIKNRFAVRIPLGADLFESIHKFCVDHNILNGRFSGIGSLKSAAVGHFRQVEKTQIINRVAKPCELVHLFGNISEKNSVPVVTGKLTVSDQDSKIFGGELVSGNKVFNAEVFIEEFSGIDLHREYDPSTGLSIWPQSLTI